MDPAARAAVELLELFGTDDPATADGAPRLAPGGYRRRHLTSVRTTFGEAIPGAHRVGR